MQDIIRTPNAPNPIGPYSQAIRAGGLIFVSGQIPLNPATGQVVEGGISIQTRQVIENLKAILDAAGSSLEKVVKTSVFLTDLDDFSGMNHLYQEYFDEIKPARTTAQVTRLPRGVLVEIDAVALA